MKCASCRVIITLQRKILRLSEWVKTLNNPDGRLEGMFVSVRLGDACVFQTIIVSGFSVTLSVVYTSIRLTHVLQRE